jgi:hypothetical protein
VAGAGRVAGRVTAGLVDGVDGRVAGLADGRGVGLVAGFTGLGVEDRGEGCAGRVTPGRAGVVPGLGLGVTPGLVTGLVGLTPGLVGLPPGFEGRITGLCMLSLVTTALLF